MSIELRAVSKRFGAFVALHAINLRIETGELVALLGPSGSGKTTLLRAIMGLERPDAGDVFLFGSNHTDQPAQARGIGFVFQHYALFRHMTVRENVAFGLRVRPRKTRPPEAEIMRRVTELLSLVQVESLAERLPSQLSGGQRQRVALARALAVEPRVLLLDEPFGALDSKVRAELRRWLRRLHEQMAITTVLVTHDQDEAMEVADRLVVMRAGRIEQVGTPDEVYRSPQSPFVCDFMGRVNIFHGRVQAGQVVLSGSPPRVATNGHASSSTIGHAPAPDPDQDASSRQDTSPDTSHPPDQLLYVRPDMLRIERQPTLPWSMRASVARIAPLGPIVRVILSNSSDPEIQADLPRAQFETLALAPGDSVYVSAIAAQSFSALDGLVSP